MCVEEYASLLEQDAKLLCKDYGDKFNAVAVLRFAAKLKDINQEFSSKANASSK